MTVELATGYVSIVPTAKGITGGLAGLLGGPAAVAGKTAGTEAGKGMTSGLQSASSGIGSVIKKNAVIPLLGLGVAAFAAAESVESAENTIIRTTGATGKAADSLKESFKNVAGKTPADFKTVATAMAEVSQRTHLTGSALETLTLQVVTFNRITKDSPLNVQDLTRTLAGFNIPAKEMSKNLDQLFKVSQKTGVPLNDLVSTLGTAGPVLRQFNLPIASSAALLATLDKAGIATSQFLPGLRKAMVGFAKDGEKPADALRKTITSMNDMIRAGNVAGARQLAVQVFGARGAGLVDAAIQGKLHLDDLNKSIQSLGKGKGILDTAASTSTLAAKFGILKNQASLALAEIGKPVLEGFTGLLKAALPILTGVADAFAAMPGPVKTAAAAFIAFAVLRSPILRIAGAFDFIGPAVTKAMTSGTIAMEGFAATTEATEATVVASSGGIRAALGTAALGFSDLAALAATVNPAGLSIILGNLIPDDNAVDRAWKKVSATERRAVADGIRNAQAHGKAYTFVTTQIGITERKIKTLQDQFAKRPTRSGFDLLFGSEDEGSKRLIKSLNALEAKHDALKASLKSVKDAVTSAGGSVHGATVQFQALAGVKVPSDLLAGLDKNGLNTFQTDLQKTVGVFGTFVATLLVNSGLSRDAIKQLTDSTAQLDQGIAQSFNSATSTVQAFSGATTVSADQFIQKQKDMIASSLDWANKLKLAAALGVDQGLIQELATAGPKSAPILDGLLAAVSKNGVDQINLNEEARRQILDGIVTDINNHAAAAAVAGANVGRSAGQGIHDGLASKREAIRQLVNTFLVGITLTLPKIGGIFGNVPGNMAGGTLGAFQPSWVGEAGKELFIPEVNGRILSHADSMKALMGQDAAVGGVFGGGQTVVYVDAMVADARAGRAIGEALDKHFANGGSAGRGLVRGN
jgi:hypothetical protein